MKENLFKHKWAEKRSLFLIFLYFSFTLMPGGRARGNPCQTYLWKTSKNSLYRFEKYFVFWYPYVPLFHLPYKVWTLTPWFRLWCFWPTVKVYMIIKCRYLLDRCLEIFLTNESTSYFQFFQISTTNTFLHYTTRYYFFRTISLMMR